MSVSKQATIDHPKTGAKPGLGAAVWAKARELAQRPLAPRLFGTRAKIDHPLADNKRVQQILDGLPYANARQTLDDASHWLASLTESPAFCAEQSYQLASRFDTATRKCQARLLETYFALKEDDFAEEKRIWKTLIEFWTLLGNAYLASARACGQQPISAGMQAQLPVLAARGLRALRHQLKCILLRYGAVRTELWAECGLFVALAESVRGADARIMLYDGDSQQTSANDEFVRLTTFWALAPTGLSPFEQDMAERMVLHLADKCRLSVFQERSFDYFFDLAGTHPPLRLVRSSPWSPQTRYVDVGQARQAVQVMHAMAVSGQLPPGVNWGAAAEPVALARVAAHVMLNWAKDLPARAFERRKAGQALTVVHGYLDVLGVVAPDSAEGAAGRAGMDTWYADDVSAGGYGVIVPAGAGEWIHVGNLVALRGVGEAAWQLGVVRRVAAHTENRRHIGVQLLSQAAQPVQLRTLAGAARDGKRQWAMRLNARPAADSSVYFLVRRDLFSGREAVQATNPATGESVTLQPGGLVESGQDFDWLRYIAPPPKL